MNRLPPPEKIKVRSRRASLVVAGGIAFGVALFVALIFAAMLVVIHANDKSALQTRREVVVVDCRQQNARNARTIGFFQGYVRHYEKTHPQIVVRKKRELQASIQSDITLINDLAPRQNCVKLAHQLYPDQHKPFWQFP